MDNFLRECENAKLDKSSLINVPSKSTNKILLLSMFFKIRNSNCDMFL